MTSEHKFIKGKKSHLKRFLGKGIHFFLVMAPRHGTAHATPHVLYAGSVVAFHVANARVLSLSALHKARKVAERKFPEFFNFLSRILARISLRSFSEFSEEFSCFVLWETETRKNSPKIPAIFQCKTPRQIRKKYSQNVSGEDAK